MSKLCIKNNSKHFLLLMGLIVVLMGILVPTTNIWAADCPTGSVWISNISPPNYGSCVTDNPQIRQQVDQVNAQNTKDSGLGGWIWKKFAQGVGYTLITLSSLALLLCGWLFDLVIQYTIIDMAKNLGGGPGGIGDAITLAWATLRDIANMCFIFILLYAAFKTMFDSNFGNFQTTVKNIIIVALLINFSLFFSKVVIDSSNIVAIGFYNSITTGQTTLSSGSGTAGGSFEKSISANYMNMLGLQTFFGANILTNENLTEGWQILTVGIMTAVFMLITAVILLIVGVMFIARFVILIFIMILSPLALIAYIIPGMKGLFEKWKSALIDQSFFAPLYFALTWVVFKLGTALIGVLGAKPTAQWSEITTNPQGVMPLILNYVLIMGFSIAALIFAKTMATKTAGFKAISGGIGAGVLGGAGLVGRQTIGRGAKWAADSSGLRDAASSGKWYSGAARAGLWTANKGGKASFDTRGLAETKLGKATGAGKMMDIAGKAGGKGGFGAAVDAKAKEKAQYAKDVYGQTEQEKAEAKKRQPDYDIEKAGEEKKIKARRLDKVDRRLASARTPEERARAEAYQAYVVKVNKKNTFDDKEYSTEFKNKDVVKEYEKYAKAGERRQIAFAERIKRESPISASTGAIVGGALGSVIPVIGTAIGAGIGAGLGKYAGGKIPMSHQGSKAAARKIIEQAKGPSKEKKLADAYKDIADTQTETPETTPETPAAPAASGTPPASGGGGGTPPPASGGTTT